MEREYNKDSERLVVFNRKLNYGPGSDRGKRARGSRPIAYPFWPGISGGPKRYRGSPEPRLGTASPSTPNDLYTIFSRIINPKRKVIAFKLKFAYFYPTR